MNDVINTGLLSFGMSGKLFHSPFLMIHNGFELSSVVERSEKKACHSYPRIKSYDSVEALLADNNIELVIVNTPNNTHFEFALKAIQKNKHVLVEKPFTITSNQAEKLFQEAKKHNRYVLPYQNRRYDSDFLSVKSVLDSGKLGRLIEVHFRFDRYKYAIGSKASKETPVPGSGLLYDLGPHLLDGVLSLFGSPLHWKKNLGCFRPNTKVDDYAYIQLSYPKELQVFITTSLLVADVQPAFILNGAKGSYVKQRADVQEKQLLEDMSLTDPLFGVEESGKEGVLTTMTKEGIKIQEKITSNKSSYMNLFNMVYKTIREGEPYPVTKEQVIKQLEILEAQ